MAYVIVGGSGSYSTGKYRFKSGATQCDDEATLKRLRENAPKWVTIQDTLEPPEPETKKAPPKKKKSTRKATPDPYQKYQGRDGKWYFHQPSSTGKSFKQEGPFDDEKAADAAIEDAKKPAEVPLATEVAKDKDAESGTLTTDDLKGKTFPCQNENCDAEFSSSGERANHERVAHPKRRKSNA